MMIAICALGVMNVAMCIALARSVGKMRDNMENLTLLVKSYSDMQQQIWYSSIFTNDALELLLWKTRQEVFTWQNLWVQAEQYEAAEQAKIVLQQIESMINFHRNQMKQNEKTDNKGTNEPVVQ